MKLLAENNRVEYKSKLSDALEKNDDTTALVPKFEIFLDSFQITSAGSIHPGKEQDEFFAGYSIPRNKTLMRVFKDLGMVAYLGSGMPRILSVYSRDVYHFSSRFIRATFPIDQKALAIKQESPITVSGETSGETSGEILHLLSSHPYMTIPELAAQIAISDRSIERNISKLCNKGLLRRIGPNKGGYWEVLAIK